MKATPGIVREPLFTYSLVAACAAPRFQIARTPRPWSSLCHEPLISLPFDNPLQQLIDGNLLRAGHDRSSRFVVNFIETQLGLAAAGCGVAIVPSTAITACHGRAVRIEPLADPVVELEFYSLRDRARALPPFAEDFCEMLRRSLPKAVAPARPFR